MIPTIKSNRKRETPVRGRKPAAIYVVTDIRIIEKEKSPWGDENILSTPDGEHFKYRIEKEKTPRGDEISN